MTIQNLKLIRINKFLAHAGLGSRRGVEELIKSGKIVIENSSHKKAIAKLGDKIDPDKDVIKIDGKIIKLKKELIYYAVNKPAGYTSTVRDVYADKLVTDLVPKNSRVFPVGRLDKKSRGLIILTNDGDLTNKLTHPKFEHEKEYEVKIQSTNEKLKSKIFKLKKGIKLQEGLAKFDKVDIMNMDEKRNIAEIKVVLHQGWKRQIRRMCEKVGLEVLDLKRVRIGKLELGDLSEGKYKIVRREEII